MNKKDKCEEHPLTKLSKSLSHLPSAIRLSFFAVSSISIIAVGNAQTSGFEPAKSVRQSWETDEPETPSQAGMKIWFYPCLMMAEYERTAFYKDADLMGVKVYPSKETKITVVESLAIPNKGILIGHQPLIYVNHLQTDDGSDYFIRKYHFSRKLSSLTTNTINGDFDAHSLFEKEHQLDCGPLWKNEGFYSEPVERLKVSISQQQVKVESIAAKKGGVQIGMTKKQVLSSNWGKPKSIHTTQVAGRVSEQWVYGEQSYLHFSDGRLSAIQQ